MKHSSDKPLTVEDMRKAAEKVNDAPVEWNGALVSVEWCKRNGVDPKNLPKGFILQPSIPSVSDGNDA